MLERNILSRVRFVLLVINLTENGINVENHSRKLWKLAGPAYPEALTHIRRLVKNAVDHTYPPSAGLRNVKNNLILVHKRFGSKVLAQTVHFLHDNFPDAYDDHTVHKVALCFKEGKPELLDRTAAFMHKHGGDWSFSVEQLIDAINSRGEKELEAGMDLAPLAGREPEGIVLPQYWRPEVENQRRRKDYVFITGRLGLDKLKSLTSRLKSVGLPDKDIRDLVSRCAYSANQDKEIARVFNAISLIKKSGLDPTATGSLGGINIGSMTAVVHDAMRRDYGTKDKLRKVLEMAAQNGVKWLSSQDFQIALRYYRKPKQRELVQIAFKEKQPHLLTFGSVYEGLMVGLGGYVEQGIDATERALDNADTISAHERTQEIMAEKYPMLGLFGPDKDFAQALAQNPVFVPDSLRPTKFESSKSLNLVDQATNQFGMDTVKSVTRFAQSGSEPEYALALLRTKNPQALIEAINRVPLDSRLNAVRVINQHGLIIFQKTLKVIKASKLEPKSFLHPIAASLANNSKELTPIKQQLFRPVFKPEHEQQLRFFYGQPPGWQRNMARAVKMYRRVYNITYPRIRYH